MKALWIILGVAVVGGGIYFATKSKDVDMVKDDNASQGMVEEEKDTTNTKQTFKELAMRNGSSECTFTMDVANSSSTGTVYVSNGNVRGNFSSTAGGKTYNSHMILKDQKDMYVWMDGSTTGFKMSIDAAAQTAQDKTSVDPNAPYDFNCKNWNTDMSVFVLPSGVTFTSMADMMKNLPSGMNIPSGYPN